MVWVTAGVAATAAGVLYSLNWVVVSLILTGVGFSVIVDAGRRADVEIGGEEERTVLRSRVNHYVRIARVTEGRRLLETATNPFERSLLGRHMWTTIPEASLKALGETTLKQVDESAFIEGHAE